MRAKYVFKKSAQMVYSRQILPRLLVIQSCAQQLQTTWFYPPKHKCCAILRCSGFLQKHLCCRSEIIEIRLSGNNKRWVVSSGFEKFRGSSAHKLQTVHWSGCVLFWSCSYKRTNKQINNKTLTTGRLFGSGLVKVSILPTQFLHFLYGECGELRSGFLGFNP